jgi:hypothetical protein
MDSYVITWTTTYTRPALSSNVSPFLGGAIAALILLTALIMLQLYSSLPCWDPSYTGLVVPWLQGPQGRIRSWRNRFVCFVDSFGVERGPSQGSKRCNCGGSPLLFNLNGGLGAAPSSKMSRSVRHSGPNPGRSHQFHKMSIKMATPRTRQS